MTIPNISNNTKEQSVAEKNFEEDKKILLIESLKQKINSDASLADEEKEGLKDFLVELSVDDLRNISLRYGNENTVDIFNTFFESNVDLKDALDSINGLVETMEEGIKLMEEAENIKRRNMEKYLENESEKESENADESLEDALNNL